MSVIDAAGNAVALTCTNEQEFGSAVVAPGTGVLLNNELTDFSEPGTANEPRPGKTPRSSMAPTIVVQRGRPVLVTGGAGGARIIMGTLFSILGVVDFGLDPAEAVDAERIDAAGPMGRLIVEGRVTQAVQDDLTRRGHRLAPTGEYDIRPRVQVAGIDPSSGRRIGQSDPRTDFAALASPRPAAGRALPPADRVDPVVRFGRVENPEPRTLVLSFRARDRGGGLASFVVQQRGPGQSAYVTVRRASAATRVRLRGLERGISTFRVRAVDRAGNVSRFDTLRVRLPRR